MTWPTPGFCGPASAQMYGAPAVSGSPPGEGAQVVAPSIASAEVVCWALPVQLGPSVSKCTTSRSCRMALYRARSWRASRPPTGPQAE
eukprot:309215-Alexandrium_andersonii.AAC.1